MKTGYVYLMSNKSLVSLYVGITNNIERRVWEHKQGESIFTSRYKIYYLMHYEAIWGMGNAIKREKQLKRWHKEWKWNLIRENNPEFRDLAMSWYE